MYVVLYGVPPSIATVRICESVKTGAVFPKNAMEVPWKDKDAVPVPLPPIANPG